MSQHLAILGAGPIGIEAALYARSLGLSVTLYDRGPAAANLLDWGHVHLFTPWRMNVTPLGVETLRRHDRWPEFPVDVCPSGEELRQHYLVPLTESEPLRHSLRLNTTILRIGRESHLKSDAIGKPERAKGGFRLLIENSEGIQQIDHADIVLDCTGTYGHHRWAGRGGIPAPGELTIEDQIFYTLPDPLTRDRTSFEDKHTLLLGCGYSAATFLKDIELLNRSHPVTKVTWAIRRPGQALQTIAADPLPARRHLVEASLRMADNPPAWLRFMSSVALESVEYAHGTFTAKLTDLETSQRDSHSIIRSDNIVALVGYSPDTSLYDQLQVHSCYATGGPMKLAAALLGESSADCLTAGANLSADTLKNPEPNFYILGAKSYGTNSNFLIQVGHNQIRDAFKLIRPQVPILA
ncbi:MAG: putative bacillithiol system oxidoreductase, YpdA family [Phycisphaerales bacterium]|nr:putative bacillithiol system oxidoreductase, YpdA family [Phycisphaerales bacterium]